jgi:hypothetical protein
LKQYANNCNLKAFIRMSVMCIYSSSIERSASLKSILLPSGGAQIQLETKYYSVTVLIAIHNTIGSLESTLSTIDSLIIVPNDQNDELISVESIDMNDFVRIVISSKVSSHATLMLFHRDCVHNDRL